MLKTILERPCYRLMAGFRFARVSQVHIIYGVTATAGFFGDAVVTLIHIIDAAATAVATRFCQAGVTQVHVVY